MYDILVYLFENCQQAELAISRQADGMLGRSERGALRAHLRECPECARAAKSVRARRGAMKSLAATPLPDPTRMPQASTMCHGMVMKVLTKLEHANGDKLIKELGMRAE